MATVVEFNLDGARLANDVVVCDDMPVLGDDDAAAGAGAGVVAILAWCEAVLAIRPPVADCLATDEAADGNDGRQNGSDRIREFATWGGVIARDGAEVDERSIGGLGLG